MKTKNSETGRKKQRDWFIRLGVAVMASLICAAIGPFTTYELFSFPGRLLYWGGLIMLLVAPAYWLRIASRRFLKGSPLQQDIMGAIIQTIFFAPIVWAFNFYLMSFHLTFPGSLFEHLGTGILIFLVPVAIRTYWRLSLFEDEQAMLSHAETAPPEEDVPLVRRLEPEMRGVILRLSADDHQLLVQTDKGTTRVRLRFSDALEELPDRMGVWIHRSHWVAMDNIASLETEGRRYILRTHCGANLPVSPSGLKNLQAAGMSPD